MYRAEDFTTEMIDDMKTRLNITIDITADDAAEISNLMQEAINNGEEFNAVLARSPRLSDPLKNNLQQANISLTSCANSLDRVDRGIGRTTKSTFNWSSALDKVVGLFDSFSKKWEELDDMAFKFGRNIGISADAAADYREEMFNGFKEIAIQYGVVSKDIAAYQQNFTEMSGRGVILSMKTLENFTALGKVVGNVNVQALTEAVDNLGGSSQTAELAIANITKRSQSRGLSAEKSAKGMVEALKMSQKYTFKEGVNGMSKMVTKAQALKTSLASTESMLDKFNDLETSITTSANLQVLGGNFANTFGNPLEMFSLAQVDAEGFQDKLMETFKGMAYFDKKKGRVDMAQIDKNRLRVAAKEMGISYDEAWNMATQGVKRDEIDKAITASGKASQLSEDNKEYLKNKAENIDGKWILTDAKGRSQEITNLSNEMIEEMKKAETPEKAMQDDVANIRALLEGENGLKTYAKDMRSLSELKEGLKENGLIAGADWLVGWLKSIQKTLLTLLSTFTHVGGLIYLISTVVGSTAFSSFFSNFKSKGLGWGARKLGGWGLKGLKVGWKGIKGAWNLGKGAWNLGKGAFGVGKTKIASAWNFGKGIFSLGKTKLLSSWNGLMTTISTSTSGLTTRVGSMFTNLWTTVSTNFRSVLGGIKNFFTSGLGNPMNWFRSGASAAASTAASASAGAAAGTGAAGLSRWSRFKNWGKGKLTSARGRVSNPFKGKSLKNLFKRGRGGRAGLVSLAIAGATIASMWPSSASASNPNDEMPNLEPNFEGGDEVSGEGVLGELQTQTQLIKEIHDNLFAQNSYSQAEGGGLNDLQPSYEHSSIAETEGGAMLEAIGDNVVADGIGSYALEMKAAKKIATKLGGSAIKGGGWGLAADIANTSGKALGWWEEGGMVDHGLNIASSTAMGASIGSAIPVVGTAVGAAVGAIYGVATEFGDDIHRKANELLDSDSIIDNVGGFLLNNASNALETVKDAFDTVGNVATDIVGGIWDGGKHLGKGIYKAFTDGDISAAVDGFVDGAKDVVRGLANGVKDLVSGAWNVAKDIGNTVTFGLFHRNTEEEKQAKVAKATAQVNALIFESQKIGPTEITDPALMAKAALSTIMIHDMLASKFNTEKGIDMNGYTKEQIAEMRKEAAEAGDDGILAKIAGAVGDAIEWVGEKLWEGAKAVAGWFGFAEGGIVENGEKDLHASNGDSTLIAASEGEMVLTEKQQARLFEMANGIGVPRKDLISTNNQSVNTIITNNYGVMEQPTSEVKATDVEPLPVVGTHTDIRKDTSVVERYDEEIKRNTTSNVSDINININGTLKLTSDKGSIGSIDMKQLLNNQEFMDMIFKHVTSQIDRKGQLGVSTNKNSSYAQRGYGIESSLHG